MLFLFNDSLFELGDAHEVARERGEALGLNALSLRNMRLGQVVHLTKEWIWERPALAKSDPQSAMFLAALFAWKTDEANAMLAVAPQGATKSAQVQVRLASVSLVTMQQLSELEKLGRLSSHAANMAVWSQAPAAASA